MRWLRQSRGGIQCRPRAAASDCPAKLELGHGYRRQWSNRGVQKSGKVQANAHAEETKVAHWDPVRHFCFRYLHCEGLRRVARRIDMLVVILAVILADRNSALQGHAVRVQAHDGTHRGGEDKEEEEEEEQTKEKKRRSRQRRRRRRGVQTIDYCENAPLLLEPSRGRP
jgi:hypothetical protein